MELKVTLRFDASDSFLACVDKFREAAVQMVNSGVIETLPAKDRGITRAIVTEDSVRVDRKEKVFPPVEGPAAPAESPAVPSEEPQQAVVPPTEDKAPSVADVRSAMDLCRKRIEGDGYATDTKSEGYTKYHKKLTAKFKEVSMLLGADKPSALAEENRTAFIDEVNKLDLLEDGSIGKPLPF